MAQVMRLYGASDGIIRLPVEITCGLLNELGSTGAAVAAMAYGTLWLADNLRQGQTCVGYECQGVTVSASLEEDAEGWHVLVGLCSEAAVGGGWPESQIRGKHGLVRDEFAEEVECCS